MSNKCVFSALTGLCLLLFLSSAAPATETVPEAFSGERYRHADFSVLVYDLTQSETVVDYRSQVALVPASVTKLLTTAAALKVLGPDFRFETDLAYDGTIENGILKGDLWIVAGGDPTLGSEYSQEPSTAFLEDWVAACRAHGIRRIEGRVRITQGRFELDGVAPSWLWEDLGNYYGAGVYDAAVFDNMYRIQLQSFQAGQGVRIIGTRPEMPRMQWSNTLIAKNNSKDSAYVYGEPYLWHQVIRGSIPANRPLFEVKAAMPDPPAYLVYRLEQALLQAGISLENLSSLSVPAPFGLSPSCYYSMPDKNAENTANVDFEIINKHYSQKLSEIVKVTNHVSNNMFTEYLLRQTALAQAIRPPLSQTASLEALKAFWNRHEVNTEGWQLRDACGLSPMTSVSAQTVAQVLQYMLRSDVSADFQASLPQAGKEGTVAGLCRSLPGVLRVKSGSMTGVRAYAGYYTRPQASSPTHIVVVMFNHVSLTTPQISQDLTKLLSTLAPA